MSARAVRMDEIHRALKDALERAKVGRLTGSVELALHFEDGKPQKVIHEERSVMKVVDGE